MSPVFRHGGLRLYLLKLLDEAPRHGYDVIRLLQDKFLGVYSPSPGTIYPRLARLEEEGLVTHELVDGKKVYRITDAGRAELNRRLDDLADLEDELAASVRDIAKEISRDVRETVRNLRDELTWAVRESGRSAATPGSSGADKPDKGDKRTAQAPDPAARAQDAPGPDSKAWSDATADDAQADAGKAGQESAGDRSGRAEWIKGGRPRDKADAGSDLFSGLEHLAAAFSREIRGVARQAENVSDDALGNLGKILSDTLTKIRSEVFRGPDQAPDDAAGPAGAADAADAASAAGDATPADAAPKKD